MIQKKWVADIPGFEKFKGYEIWSDGTIVSHRYVVPRKMSPAKDGQGYPFIRLSNRGTHKIIKIHRLVALAFIPNPENKPQVNHIDENKTNSNDWNLEWATVRENANHGSRNKRIGENTRNHPNKSYKVKGVHLETGKEVRFPSIAEATRNGFTESLIRKCLNGKNRHHRGYKWYRDS